MNDIKTEPMEMDVDFKVVFKGYSVPEVNEYIAQLRSEIEEIRQENGELYRKIEFFSTEMENHRTDEDYRRQLIQQAQEEAEEIIKEAKKQAAKEVLRGNRLCSRMVADMVSQVEEQKKLFIATKTEAANFRRELFERYRDHIELINAMSEATGVFDGNEISATELEDVKRILESNELSADSEKQMMDVSVPASSEEGTNLFMDAFSDTASFGAVAAPLKNKKGKNKRSALNPQEKKIEEKKPAVSEKESAGDISRMRSDNIFGEEDLFEEFAVPADEPQAEALPEAEEISAVIAEIESLPEAEESIRSEEGSLQIAAEEESGEEAAKTVVRDVFEEALAEEREYVASTEDGNNEPSVSTAQNSAFVMTEDDIEEFGNPDGVTMEYDSPVSVDSVFKKSPYNDKDFDFLYGEYPADEDDEPEVKGKRITPATVSENVERKFNSYGFDVSSMERNDPDDDSDEFYMEDDDEFDPAATEGIPTGTVGAFGISAPKTANERRWKVRRNKSLTDEFDVIKAEDEE